MRAHTRVAEFPKKSEQLILNDSPFYTLATQLRTAVPIRSSLALKSKRSPLSDQNSDLHFFGLELTVCLMHVKRSNPHQIVDVFWSSMTF